MAEHATTPPDPEIATLVVVRQGAADIERIATELLDFISGKPWFVGSEMETYLDIIADTARDMLGDIGAVAYNHGVVDLPA